MRFDHKEDKKKDKGQPPQFPQLHSSRKQIVAVTTANNMIIAVNPLGNKTQGNEIYKRKLPFSRGDDYYSSTKEMKGNQTIKPRSRPEISIVIIDLHAT